jgi:hypothetical protein
VIVIFRDSAQQNTEDSDERAKLLTDINKFLFVKNPRTGNIERYLQGFKESL